MRAPCGKLARVGGGGVCVCVCVRARAGEGNSPTSACLRVQGKPHGDWLHGATGAALLVSTLQSFLVTGDLERCGGNMPSDVAHMPLPTSLYTSTPPVWCGPVRGWISVAAEVDRRTGSRREMRVVGGGGTATSACWKGETGEDAPYGNALCARIPPALPAPLTFRAALVGRHSSAGTCTGTAPTSGCRGCCGRCGLRCRGLGQCRDG